MTKRSNMQYHRRLSERMQIIPRKRIRGMPTCVQQLKVACSQIHRLFM